MPNFKNMKKSTISFLLILVTAIFIVLGINGCTDDKIKKNLSCNNLKAISLKELQKKLTTGTDAEIKEIKDFYGINNLYGFYWDEKAKDLILFGEADATKPHLQFDDFVVSLRYNYMLYTEKKGDTNYYQDPSCTIDPNVDTWNRLDRLENDNNRDPDANDSIYARICGEPQFVKVFGIPPASHLASLMVNADYVLKDITNGTLQVQTPGGFKSMAQMRRENVEEAVKKNKPVKLGSPINRFEFTAGKACFQNNDEIYILWSLPIVLVTEAEYQTKTEIKGTGKTDPLAKDFTISFNKNYKDIAKKVPVYDSLANAYRIFAISKALAESNLITDITFYDQILKNYKIDTVPVQQTLPGKSMINRVDYYVKGQQQTHYLYSCGGVNLTSTIEKAGLRKVIGNDFMRNIISAKPGPEAIQWGFKVNSKAWTLFIHRMYLLKN